MSNNGIPAFERYVGIDYSGAETPTTSLRGLRVYMADRESLPVEMQPRRSPRKYWTRRGIAEWLVKCLSEERLTLGETILLMKEIDEVIDAHGGKPDAFRSI